MSSKPDRQDLNIYKGRDFSRSYAVKDSAGAAIPLTGYDIQSQLRATEARSGTLIKDFAVVIDEPAGTFVVSMSDTDTGEITQNAGFYDILAIDAASNDNIWIYGEVDIHETVTVKQE
jgi:hypothetical protein